MGKLAEISVLGSSLEGGKGVRKGVRERGQVPLKGKKRGQVPFFSATA
jgi:hypothetical protein